jgi:hypothetical protein
MKNNKATGCDGICAEAWKMLVTNAVGTEILTKVFNMIRHKREFPKQCKTALIQPIYKVRGSHRALGNYTGFHYYQLWQKYIQERELVD